MWSYGYYGFYICKYQNGKREKMAYGYYGFYMCNNEEHIAMSIKWLYGFIVAEYYMCKCYNANKGRREKGSLQIREKDHVAIYMCNIREAKRTLA
jgi:hypothetical protein